ncbi:MAG: hypothetical protein ACD_41C00333G0003 [uncultured bacterium]|nr:MAG: hypothetical protein ACD_41C00333G0003 [uncultured bacterium]
MDPVKTLFPHQRSNDIVSGILHSIGLGLAISFQEWGRKIFPTPERGGIKGGVYRTTPPQTSK